MKKFSFITTLLSAMCILLASCDNKQNPTLSNKELVVENVISTDREYMFTICNDYMWYETSITLDEYVDAEDCDGSVYEVKNTFRYIDEQTGDIKTTYITHTRDSVVYQTTSEFVIGYASIDDETLRLTYNEAYRRLAESNTVRPHTRICQLIMGNNNAQYIFTDDTVYVSIDAVTGAVNSEVFKEEPEEE